MIENPLKNLSYGLSPNIIYFASLKTLTSNKIVDR